MKRIAYEAVCAKIEKVATIEDLQELFPDIPKPTIEGIYHRQKQIKGRRAIASFNSLKTTHKELWTRFQMEWEDSREGNEMILIGMAKEYSNVPPCYLARLVVKGYTEHHNAQLKQSQGDYRILSDEENDGEKLFEDKEERRMEFMVYTKLYKEPLNIPHKGLRANVESCHRYDAHYSPAMDTYRSEIGLEYEAKLAIFLEELSIPFLTETHMRTMKYARTPDAILLEPICIDGTITVKWIESKAWFGDPGAHATYLRDQYWPYYNRFGPGLVIYWFGFVEEIVVGHQMQGVAVMDHFPDASRIIRLRSRYEAAVKEARQ